MLWIGQAIYMSIFYPEMFLSRKISFSCRQATGKSLRSRLRTWQQSRSWARLIREAENLWHVDIKELRLLGALELTQLIQEVPTSYRKRVNRWLDSYSVSTRFNDKL